MSYELRPLSLAEILDAGFRLVQTNWRTLIGLAMIMQIPMVLLGYFVPWLFDPLSQPDMGSAGEMTPERLGELGAGFGLVSLLYLILYPFIAAAVTASVGNAYLGRAFTLGDAARAGRRSILRLLAAYLVWLFAFFGVAMIIATLGVVVFAIGGAAVGGLIEAPGTLGTVIVVTMSIGLGGLVFFGMFFAAVVSALLPPIVVLESEGIWRSVRRAFSLGGTAKMRVVGIIMTTGFIVGIPVMGAQMLIGVIPGAGLAIWATFQAIGFAFSTSVTVVLYFDLRCRAENYDLEHLAQQVEAGPGFGRG